MESLQDEIREIRKQLRLAMNGVISTSMREKGIVYKLNFGVPYPEIKEIARKHKPNGELAAALWKEEIVELDEEKKAAMVSNLLVVLCADEPAQPVINSGTLNH